MVTALWGPEAAWLAGKLGLSQLVEKYDQGAREIHNTACSHLWNEQEQYFVKSIKPLNKEIDAMTSWGSAYYPTAQATLRLFAYSDTNQNQQCKELI